MFEHVLLRLIDDTPAILAAVAAVIAAVNSRQAKQAARAAHKSADMNGQALIDCPYVRLDQAPTLPGSRAHNPRDLQ